VIDDLLCVRDFWSGLRLASIVFFVIYTPFGIQAGLTIN